MHLWPELAFMPPLSHWPDRPQPYLAEHSEVLKWLAKEYHCDLHVADRIFQSARNKGVIGYDSITHLWCGQKGGE